MTKIAWNGCDGYVEVDEALRRGCDFDGHYLYHRSQRFTPFEAVEISPTDLQKDEDGEPIVDGVFGTETGRFYKAA